ncbi:MAG: hypothetical protein K6U04_16275 [Armatimonadetes bacterium]|nr:hypothetical protein [Armatimonadota bacterium]
MFFRGKRSGQVLPVVSGVQKHWWRWLLVGACLLAVAYFSGQFLRV